MIQKTKIISIAEGQTALVIDSDGSFNIVGFKKDDSLLFVMLSAYLLETKEYFDKVKEGLTADPDYVEDFNNRISLSDGMGPEDTQRHENN